jgi:hypothetical protein
LINLDIRNNTSFTAIDPFKICITSESEHSGFHANENYSFERKWMDCNTFTDHSAIFPCSAEIRDDWIIESLPEKINHGENPVLHVFVIIRI